MRTTIVALAAGLAATASAGQYDCSPGQFFNFFNRNGDALSYQRLDPALYPGTQSPHLHSFDGGSGLSASTDFAEIQTSSCTTNRIKPDKSLYWRPTLFWNGNGTGFHRVPESYLKIYYKYQDNYDFAEFPKDFNMIAGDPMRRSEDGNTGQVRWSCKGPDGGADIFTPGFPKGFQSCKSGFAGEVTFPSCWNGEKLDPKNPNAHMAYANQIGDGIEKCPSTHRKARFPDIFIEFWYDVSSFDNQYGKDDVPWVLSNGDPTGFGFHADFLNGWQEGLLKKAVSLNGGLNCGCSCNQDNLEAYFGKENINNDQDAAFKSCSVIGAVNSDASPVLSVLPGCNPIQSGPARATVVTGAGCAATAVPATAGNNSSAVYSASSSIASAVSSAGSSMAPAASVGSSQTYAASSSVVISGMKTSSSRTGRWPHPSSTKKNDDPMLSISLPNKQVGDGYGFTSVKASATAVPIPASLHFSAIPYVSNSTASVAPTQGTGAPLVLPSLSLASTAVPAAGMSSGIPSGGNNADCTAPVYVTVTPTVYVTIGANSTSCASSAATITKTLTQIATITMDAQSSMGYGSN